MSGPYTTAKLLLDSNGSPVLMSGPDQDEDVLLVSAKVNPLTGGIIKKSGGSILRPDRAKYASARMRDISLVAAGVTITVNTIAASIAAGFSSALSPSSATKVLGCATEVLAGSNMYACLTANPQNAVVGVESLVIGSKFSFRFLARDPLTRQYWVFVNDKPATASPVDYTTTGYFEARCIDIDLPDAGPNIVTVYASNVAGITGVACSSAGALSASDRNARKIAITGDSFVAGSSMAGGAFNTFSAILAVRYGYDVLNNGIGGTGYVNDGGGTVLKAFGHESRVKNVRAFSPDEHIFFGSVNDNGLPGVSDAVRQTISSYRAACDCISSLIGVQPTGTDKTLLASLETARIVYSAASSNQLLDRYIDPLGCADIEYLPATFAAGTYQPNDRVTVQNAIWSFDSDAPSALTATQGPLGADASAKPSRWRQRTLWLYGAGNAGSGGTYSRASLLGSDNTHYTHAGNAIMAASIDSMLSS